MFAGLECIYTVDVVCDNLSLIAQFCKYFQFNSKCRKCKKTAVYRRLCLKQRLLFCRLLFCRLEVSLLYVQECLHRRLPDNRHCQIGAHSKRAPLNPLKPPDRALQINSPLWQDLRQNNCKIPSSLSLLFATVKLFNPTPVWMSNGTKGYIMSVYQNTSFIHR